MTDPELSRARSAAIAFCRDAGFAPEQLTAIEMEPPLLGPVDFERDGRTYTAYRWLGGGRGGDYVQVEVDAEMASPSGARTVAPSSRLRRSRRCG